MEQTRAQTLHRKEPAISALRAAAWVTPSLLFALPWAAFIAAHPLMAQTLMAQTAPTTPSAAKRELDQQKQGLEATRRKALTLETDVAGIDAERARLNTQLVQTAALVQQSESKLTEMEARVAVLEKEEKGVRSKLAVRHGEIAHLLAALQRMGRNPPPVLITQREDALKMVRSAMLLASAFPGLKTQAVTLVSQLDRLVQLLTEIKIEGEKLRAETTRLNEARTSLSSLIEAKRTTVVERQKELQAVRLASAEISNNVSSLTDLIAKLDKTVTAETGLGAYETERKASVAIETAATSPVLAPPATAPAAVAADVLKPVETQVATLVSPPSKQAYVELAPGTANGAATANAGRIKPAIPFQQATARLPRPAHGKTIVDFGAATQYGGRSKGIVIETRSGAQITAPCDGWIVYAGEFRSYGQLLIINAGDGYHVLLAGMSQMDVQPGQFVLAAEPVGTMSGGPRTAAPQAESKAPVLYIEFRKDGRPIDPGPWWATSQQKVQG